MSLNQSKSDKSDSQNRKSGGGGRSGSSGQQRTFTGGSGRGGGGSTAPHLVTNPSSLSANRSFKKTHNVQGVQSRVSAGSGNATENAAPAARAPVQNGAHSQSTLHAVTSKQNDSAQRSVWPIPKAPSSQSSTMKSDSTTTSTTLAKGDGGKGFPLQFGSINPGLMNGKQVPARTTSAPPNIDEQKRDQVQHAPLKGATTIPVTSAPKPQVPRKDVAPIPQHLTGEINPDLKGKRDTPVTFAPPASQAQKTAVHPMTGISMQMQYPQPSVPMQFGGPNLQMQSQGMPATSLPMPMQMPLHLGNPSQVQQQLFMPGIQHPMVQPHGIMHQGLGFNPQMSQLPHQLGSLGPHQLGSLGMNISPQFPPHQPAKYGNTRKTVKITHPDTHEELMLDKRTDMNVDGSSSLRMHQNMPPGPYASGHPINYYPNSYTAAPYFASPSSSLPLTNAQLTPVSQASRFNYPVRQAPHTMSFPSNSAPISASAKKGGTIAHGTTESSSLDFSGVTQSEVSSVPVSVTIKPATRTTTEKRMESRPVEEGQAPRISRLAADMCSPQFQKDYKINPGNHLSHSKLGPEQLKPLSASVGEDIDDETTCSVSASSHCESSSTTKKEAVAGSDSVKENQKKPVKEGHAQLADQVGTKASSGLSPQSVEGIDVSFNMVAYPPVDSRKDLSESGACHDTVEACIEQPSAVGAAPRDDGGSGGDVLEGSTCSASDIVGSGHGVDAGIRYRAQGEDLPPQAETSGAKKYGEKENHDGLKPQKLGRIDVDLFKPAEIINKSNLTADLKGGDYATELVDTYVPNVHDQCKFAFSDGTTETSDTSLKATECKSGNETVKEVYSSGHESDAISVSVVVVESSSRLEGECLGTARPSSSSGSVLSSSKAFFESNKSKSTARGRKKIKQILQKADSQGTTSDLYMAYKSSEEKKESMSSTECHESTSNNDLKSVCDESNHENASLKEKDDGNKAGPDDWEDAADVSTPELQSTSIRDCELARQDGEGAGTAKKYSRDFLLTFSEQYTNLPEGFEITSDIADILRRPKSSSSRVVDHEYLSPGRIIDRPLSGPKGDRRGSGMMDADRWNKLRGSFPSSREMGLDPGYGPMSTGFRPGHGGHHGVLRNLCVRPPVQYPILSGPTQSMQRNHSDADSWRSMNFKGLMPPPQTPMQIMHKAEKKYEVGKVTDEEEAKQRKLKGILNKLTPQNFDKLFAQVKEVNIDNVITLNGVISQIFDKALMEPTFCEMYSNFCYQLSLTLPELSVDDEKITFKRLLLNKCQEEFEKGEREEEEANKVDSEDETKLTEEVREARRLKGRRRMLGNIRLIGELYKKKMLTERIMHNCISKLLGQYPNSVEEDIESLCKLMSTIGEMIDHPRAKKHMDAYFDMMANLSNNMKLSSRVRFMLKDVIDLRKNRWQQRRKVEGPKKIEEVHRDAAQERQAQTTRVGRVPSMASSMRRGQPVDFGPRGSNMSSPVGQMGSFRGLPSQVRTHGMQDVRREDRNSFDSRTISVPLPQRPSGDDSVTLGPQGGLARGMSIRGQPSISSAPVGDNSLIHGDARRTGGLSSMSGRAAFNLREDSFRRYTPPERLDGSQSSMQDSSASSINRDNKNVDHNLDRSILASPSKSVQGTSSDKVWPEERLREKSIAAIKEFYSAKDEKEVDMCVRELNAPDFYPSVISIWVTDSFEKKDMERDMLNKLIVNLSKPRDGRLFMPDQLIKGIEAVLTNLEDTVNDAPKAPDYLGHLLARVVLENVVSLQEIGGLLYEGGEEPGRLREEGLAGDVLGSILENIKSEKGESAVNDICATSNLRLEDFRPPDPLKSKKLELFI